MQNYSVDQECSFKKIEKPSLRKMKSLVLYCKEATQKYFVPVAFKHCILSKKWTKQGSNSTGFQKTKQNKTNCYCLMKLITKDYHQRTSKDKDDIISLMKTALLVLPSGLIILNDMYIMVKWLYTLFCGEMFIFTAPVYHRSY